MAAPKKVERRSDGEIFWSAGEAGASVGRPGIRIAQVCRITAEGIYAEAYGHQWRYWKPGNMPAWPEKSDTRRKKAPSSKRAAKRAMIAAVLARNVCPAGYTGECPHLQYSRCTAASLVRSIPPSSLETIQNERQTSD